MENQRTLQGYFEALFESTTIIWKDVYLIPRNTTINTEQHSFQYKYLLFK